MPAPRAIPDNRPLWKLAAVCVIAGVGVLAGLFIQRFAGTESSSRSIDWNAYDFLFRRRAPEDRQGGPIVLVVVDDWSLSLMEKYLTQRWPWPRESYAKVIEAAEAGGGSRRRFRALPSTDHRYTTAISMTPNPSPPPRKNPKSPSSSAFRPATTPTPPPPSRCR